ncbi:MAG: iron transporter [Tissierellia bacterium]|nr:iron transporter [Tissierellia bacterium]
MNKRKISKIISLLIVFGMIFFMAACGPKNEGEPAPANENAAEETNGNNGAEEAEDNGATENEAAAPGEDANAPGGGFEEFDIGDPHEEGPLIVAGVYFQPVDMEPAGNSLAKEEADCHIEADISASEKGAELGYGVGDFVPWLQVKALVQKEGSDKVDEVAFMPMNASDGPHYGANYKFPEGLGKYNIKFEISAPGNEYLLHVDKETGVTGRFWTEPIVVEWPDFEWAGPQW